jgi:hypothetical protein
MPGRCCHDIGIVDIGIGDTGIVDIGIVHDTSTGDA